MAKSAHLTTVLSRIFNRTTPSSSSSSSSSFHSSSVCLKMKLPPQFSSSRLVCLLSLNLNHPFPLIPKTLSYSTTATAYPLQYDMIVSRPAHQHHHPTPTHPRRLTSPKSKPTDQSDGPDSSEELGFDDWVDKKLNSAITPSPSTELDRSKRKYYNKRTKRMYGSDTDDENNRQDGNNDFVELKQQVVDFRTLHKREEELYFYDTFAYPWEKEKHYKMVYQLEKKYFPDQGFDKAFLAPGQQSNDGEKKKKGNKRGDRSTIEAKTKQVEDKGIVFFDDEKENIAERDDNAVKIDVSEKKVEEFFKCLKKVPNKETDVANAEPFLSSRSEGLPPKWDSPAGTVVLVNKPKGEPCVL